MNLLALLVMHGYALADRLHEPYEGIIARETMAVFGSETVDEFMADGHPVDSWFVLFLFHRCSRLLGDSLSRDFRFRGVILWNIREASSGNQHHGQRVGNVEHAGNKTDGDSD